MTVYHFRVSPDRRRLAVLTDTGGHGVVPAWFVVEVDHSVVDDSPLDRLMGAVDEEDVADWDRYTLCPLDAEEET